MTQPEDPQFSVFFDRFEQAWQRGFGPEIESFLPVPQDALSRDDGRRIEQARVNQVSNILSALQHESEDSNPCILKSASADWSRRLGASFSRRNSVTGSSFLVVPKQDLAQALSQPLQSWATAIAASFLADRSAA